MRAASMRGAMRRSGSGKFATYKGVIDQPALLRAVKVTVMACAVLLARIVTYTKL